MIQKLENERDYHHNNHVELRKKDFITISKEFELKQLKRDNYFLKEQLEAFKKKNEE